MLFLDRRTPLSDQNPKNFQFHQKQLKFPIDCATSHPNRPTELRDIIENRTFFFVYKKKGCDRGTEYPFKDLHGSSNYRFFWLAQQSYNYTLFYDDGMFELIAVSMKEYYNNI